jgi:hypothetical protein
MQVKVTKRRDFRRDRQRHAQQRQTRPQHAECVETDAVMPIPIFTLDIPQSAYDDITLLPTRHRLLAYFQFPSGPRRFIHHGTKMPP